MKIPTLVRKRRILAEKTRRGDGTREKLLHEGPAGGEGSLLSFRAEDGRAML